MRCVSFQFARQKKSFEFNLKIFVFFLFSHLPNQNLNNFNFYEIESFIYCNFGFVTVCERVSQELSSSFNKCFWFKVL